MVEGSDIIFPTDDNLKGIEESAYVLTSAHFTWDPRGAHCAYQDKAARKSG